MQRFQLAALEWDCGIVDTKENHMYFADNEPNVEPGSVLDYTLIIGGSALAVAVMSVLLTLAAWQLGWVTL